MGKVVTGRAIHACMLTLIDSRDEVVVRRPLVVENPCRLLSRDPALEQRHALDNLDDFELDVLALRNRQG